MRAPTRIPLAILVIFALPFPGLAIPAVDKPDFLELWAYLLDGEEKYFAQASAVTDLAYFGAGLNSKGKLVGVPAREKVKAFPGRVHLVVAEASSIALTHFALDPAFPLRDALVQDILKAAPAFDGVQIDFEAVGQDDLENFHAFLGLLKAGLGSRTLSVALPARMNEATDRFGYARVAKVADRVMVMAYDEHYGSSEPGPVASMAWCKSVAAYALAKVGPERLVMGLPFYGRGWADKNPARAYRYSGVADLLAAKGLAEIKREDYVPFVEYEDTVKVKVYFEDRASILARLDLYRNASVRNVAFWRLGQEDPEIWKGLPPRILDKVQAPEPTATPSAGPAALPAVIPAQSQSGPSG